MNEIPAANHSFKCLDEILKQHRIEPLSLSPRKTFSTSFTDLGNTIVQTTNRDPAFINVFENTLMNVLDSVLSNFPENVFWDFDFFVASMLKQALAADKGAEYFLKIFDEKITVLMNLFGNKSNIHFRYLHDFLYGFDWAKWAQANPQSRCLIEPFDLEFLDYLLGRGQEILQLIDRCDMKYHQLDGISYRNPFCFSRKPKDEMRLLAHLARRNFIPVVAWDWHVAPVWNKPFHETRKTISIELHLVKEN